MPQLDLAIGFSQIFWLIIVFIIIYVLVIHYILPLYIKAFKSRKLLLELSKVKCQKLDLDFTKFKIYVDNLLENKLSLANQFFCKDFKNLIFNSRSLNFESKYLDNLHTRFLVSNTLYSNKEVLDSILLNTKFRNKK